jgi:hypothetical protein
VRGRLSKAIQSWIDIRAPQFILDLIVNGYKIPFIDSPPSFVGKNNASARREYMFVEQSIVELIECKCIEDVFSPPDIINPLSVSIQKSGKKRS